MGKLGEEVSGKIKSAIKAKLTELGIHIDNELPDYVMVLVANKKTQTQMEDDLSLFLGESTKEFTGWLHCVLKKLEQVTIPAKVTKKSSEAVKLRRKLPESEHESIRKRIKPDYSSSVKESEHFLSTDNVTSNGKRIKLEMASSDGEDNDVLHLHADNSDNKMVGLPVRSSVEAERSNTNIVEKEQRRGDVILAEERQVDYRRQTLEKEESKPRERIHIVWEKDSKTGGSSGEALHEKSSTGMPGRDLKLPSRDRPSRLPRSRSRDRSRRDRGKSREKYNSGQSSTPPRTTSNREKKLIDARDLINKRGSALKRNGNVKTINKTRGTSSSPTRKSLRDSHSKENREKLSSVLKAVIKVPDKQPSLPSLVQVKPRPSRTPGVQPNCNLILKAVADAEKSVASSKSATKNVDDEVEGKKKNDRKRFEVIGNISVTLLNDRVSASKPGVPEGSGEAQCEPADKTTGHQVSIQAQMLHPNVEEERLVSQGGEGGGGGAQEEEMVVETGEGEAEISTSVPLFPNDCSITNRQTLDEQIGKRFIITLDSTASDNEIDTELEVTPMQSEVADSDQIVCRVERKFDRSRLGPKLDVFPDIFDDEMTGNLLFEGENIPPSLSRCKFWPCCDAGDSCIYFHPKSLCKMFPTCHFGDKCLYIHPACKFADNCLNPKCPYSHNSVTPTVNFRASAPTVMVNSTTPCVYYPNCSKPFCPYLHVKKPCRFGSLCSKIGCEFDHGPAKNPYKWVASQ